MHRTPPRFSLRFQKRPGSAIKPRIPASQTAAAPCDLPTTRSFKSPGDSNLICDSVHCLRIETYIRPISDIRIFPLRTARRKHIHHMCVILMPPSVEYTRVERAIRGPTKPALNSLLHIPAAQLTTSAQVLSCRDYQTFFCGEQHVPQTFWPRPPTFAARQPQQWACRGVVSLNLGSLKHMLSHEPRCGAYRMRKTWWCGSGGRRASQHSAHVVAVDKRRVGKSTGMETHLANFRAKLKGTSTARCKPSGNFGAGYASSCRRWGVLVAEWTRAAKITAACMATQEEFGVATGFLDHVALDADSATSELYTLLRRVESTVQYIPGVHGGT
ncbi:hypothetical protein PSPO01_10720 [Paraphaeosphaeria sporulosa]